MPYFEVRFIEEIDLDMYDIFKEIADSGDNDDIDNGVNWDYYVPLDYQKLSKYIQIQLSIRSQRNNVSTYLTTDFRQCTASDFENNGYVGKIPIGVDYIFCPETEKIKDFYKLNNGYYDHIETDSFSIEMISCNSDTRDDCKSEDEIRALVPHLLFTQYFIKETIDYRDKNNYKSRPTRIESIFFS